MRARAMLFACAVVVPAALSMPAMAAGEGSIRTMIARHAAASGVPVQLADAVVRVESRYNPKARNRANLGLTQISHATARSLGYAGGAGGLLDPETNLRFGLRYLAEAHRRSGGDVCGTVMRYQSGLGATRMSAANRTYCGKVRAILAGRGISAGRAG